MRRDPIAQMIAIGRIANAHEPRKQLRMRNANDRTNSRSVTDSSDTNAGWMVGGGLEYAITNHWKAPVQYQYIDLGDVSLDRESTEVDFSTGRSELELREHNGSLALMYQF